MARQKDSADGSKSRTDRVLLRIGRKLFPPDPQGKDLDVELRGIADGEDPKRGGR